MVLLTLGAFRYSGVDADIVSLPLNIEAGAIFDAVDTLRKFVFNGTAWVEFVKGTGEINEMANVGVGTGLIFRDKIGVTFNIKSLIGGTNVTVIDNADDITISTTGASPLTTKGDLFGFSTVDERVPIGIDGQILFVDSSTAVGLKYGDLLFTKGQLLAFDTGISQLTVGADGQILQANSAQPTGLEWVTSGASSSPTFDDVRFDRQASIPNPVGDQSREGLIQIDVNNDAKVINMKIDGGFKQVRFF